MGPDGRLYYLALAGGSVFAIRSALNEPPEITAQPANQTMPENNPATFTVTASGSGPRYYQWLRDAAPIPGAASNSLTLARATLGDAGAAFRCVISNLFGSITSNPALLFLAPNQDPIPMITSPSNGSFFAAGDLIQFTGTATDPEDGALPPGALSWTIVFHHDTHTHPFLGPINGVTNGAFTIPTTGETSTNVWYRLWLTVTDSGGRQKRDRKSTRLNSSHG